MENNLHSTWTYQFLGNDGLRKAFSNEDGGIGPAVVMRLRRVVLAVGFSTTLLAVCRMIADQVTAMGVEVLKNEVDNGDGANGLYFTTADSVSRVTVVHGERETVRESLEFTDSERSLPTPVKSPDRPLHPQVLLESQFGQEPSALYLREQGGPGAGVVVVAQDKRADYEGKLPRADQDHSAPVEQAMEGKVQLFELGHVSTFPPKTFRVRTPFHFPQPLAVQPLTQVLHSQWMEELRETVNSMQCDQITMVTSNLPYREVLLNWLVSAIVRAKIPLQSILVISMDEPVHRALKEKGVNSVLTTPASFLSGSVRSMGTFPQVMMTRLAIIRLLNHWGFHVVNYDTDAIILRNPQDVFDRLSESGVIGTFGKFPKQLNRLWGVTLCTAVLVVRSSPETGETYFTVYTDCHTLC